MIFLSQWPRLSTDRNPLEDFSLRRSSSPPTCSNRVSHMLIMKARVLKREVFGFQEINKLKKILRRTIF